MQGNTTILPSISVTVNNDDAPENDLTPPFVSIITPLSTQTVSDTVVITSFATDNHEVSQVMFYVNDQLIQTVTDSPFTASWITYDFPNNSEHVIHMTATDPSGNQSNAQPVLVTVVNEYVGTINNLTVLPTENTLSLSWDAPNDAESFKVYKDGSFLVEIGEQTYNDVVDHLNVLDYQYYFKITEQLITNDISSLIVTFNEIIDNGFDGQHFINGLSEHLRKLLLCQHKQTVNLFSVNDSLKEKYLNQSEITDVKFLVEALKLTNTCDLQYKSSNNKRLLVEICLMQVSSINFQDITKKKSKNFIVSSSNKKANDLKLLDKELSIKEDSSIKKESQDLISKIKLDDVPQISNDEQLPKSKTISILSSLTQESVLDNKKTIKTNSENFSNDDLIAGWNEMKVYFSENKKTNLVLALDVEDPVLKEDYKIEITLSNTSQVELVQDEKMNILDFLRKKMNNDFIDLNFKVNEINKEDIPYTNSDKFKKMYEKNKNLEILGQKLGLDPDY